MKQINHFSRLAAMLLMAFMALPLWAEEIPETETSYGSTQNVGIRFPYRWLNGAVEYSIVSNINSVAYLTLEDGEPDAAGKPTYNPIFNTLKEGEAKFQFVKYEYDSEKNPTKKLIYNFTLTISGYASRACTYTADGTLVGSDEVDSLTMHVGEWRPIMLQSATQAEIVNGKMKVTWAFMDKGETSIYYVEDETSIKKQLDAIEAVAIGKNYVNASCYEGGTQYATAGFPIRIVAGEAKNMTVDPGKAQVHVLNGVTKREVDAGGALRVDNGNIFRCLHGLEIQEPELVETDTKEIKKDFYGLMTYQTQLLSFLYAGTLHMTGIEYKWLNGEFTRVEEKIEITIMPGRALIGYAGLGEPYTNLTYDTHILPGGGEVTDDLGMAFYYRDGKQWKQSDVQLHYEYIDNNGDQAIEVIDNGTKLKGLKRAFAQTIRVSCAAKEGCHTESSATLYNVRVLASNEVEYRDSEGKALEELEIGEGKMLQCPWIYVKGESRIQFPYMAGETATHHITWYWEEVNGEFRPNWLKGLAAGEDTIKITYAFNASKSAKLYTAKLPVHVIDPIVTPLPASTQTSIDFSSAGTSGTVILVSNSGDTYNTTTGELELATTLTDLQVEEAMADAALGDDSWLDNMKGTLAFKINGKGAIKFLYKTEEGYELKVLIQNDKKVSLHNNDYGWSTVYYDVKEPTAVVIYVVDNNSSAPARFAMGNNADSDAKVFIKSIEINPNETPTSIFTIPTDGKSVQKVLNGGDIMIIRGGKIFNAQGQIIK